jgi:pyruvate kinase
MSKIKSKIIATIGPSSQSSEVLKYFTTKKVEFARFNTSHNSVDWHIKLMNKAKRFGLKIFLDLAGPKIRIGDLTSDIDVSSCKHIILEKQDETKKYPFFGKFMEKNHLVLPIRQNICKFLRPNDLVLVNDGKIQLIVGQNFENFCFLSVTEGGIISSGKSLNFPDSHIDIDFLTSRDCTFLEGLIPKIKPDVIAASFVQYPSQIDELNRFIISILERNHIYNYIPKICTKIEKNSALKSTNLTQIVTKSDMLMVARGDLALETEPLHLMVPYYQKIIQEAAHSRRKELVIATQLLESMIHNKVPNRSEISDLYRAIVLDKAEYLLLAGETAVGKNPKLVVETVSDIIDVYANISKN